jgi:hypothetical protein
MLCSNLQNFLSLFIPEIFDTHKLLLLFKEIKASIYEVTLRDIYFQIPATEKPQPIPIPPEEARPGLPPLFL